VACPSLAKEVDGSHGAPAQQLREGLELRAAQRAAGATARQARPEAAAAEPVAARCGDRGCRRSCRRALPPYSRPPTALPGAKPSRWRFGCAPNVSEHAQAHRAHRRITICRRRRRRRHVCVVGDSLVAATASPPALARQVFLAARLHQPLLPLAPRGGCFPRPCICALCHRRRRRRRRRTVGRCDAGTGMMWRGGWHLHRSSAHHRHPEWLTPSAADVSSPAPHAATTTAAAAITPPPPMDICVATPTGSRRRHPRRCHPRRRRR
jgi:hypothetical protein